MALSFAPVPVPTPETQPFWDGLARGQVLLPRCSSCGSWQFPPYCFCKICGSEQCQWTRTSGRGRLYSYVIARRPWPEWNRDGPMSVALVELEEGPRLVSTVIGCTQDPQHLILDMPLTAAFERFGEDRTLLCFRPAAKADE